MKEIYFIRHGETDWNKLGLGQGSLNDIELNKTGVEQAEITGRYLRDFRMNDKPFDIIFSSPLKRTRSTAEIIAKNIGYDEDKIKYMKILEEIDNGLLSVGKNREEMLLDKFYDKYFELVEELNNIQDPIRKQESYEKVDEILNKYYQYETMDQLRSRLVPFVEILKELDVDKILVISHGGTIQGLNRYIMNIEHIIGDYTYGNNCHITYYNYVDGKFKLVLPPNTRHFKIYDKNYNKIF